MNNRYSGLIDQDSGLTALGWRQTDALASWLKGHDKIDLLVSAPHLRNRLTAQRVGQTIGKPVTVHKGLPVSHGMSEDPDAGYMMGSVLAKLPPGDTYSVDDPDQEGPFQIFCRELRIVLDQLTANHLGQTVAVFMGAASISATLACLFDARNLGVQVEHTSLSEIQLREGRWYVTYLNRREHLPMPTVPLSENPETPATNAEPPEDMRPILATFDHGVAAAFDSSDERVRLRVADVIKFAQLTPEQRILDVGTGAGLLPIMLAEANLGNIVGVDISPAMLERAELLRLSSAPDIARHVDFRLAAAQLLPFRKERFDALFCRLVLHLTNKPDAILREARRVLRTGGVLVLVGLLSADDPVKRATQNAIETRRNRAHVAARSSQQYHDMVESAGFTIEAEKAVTYERELDEWLTELSSESGDAAVVRDMMEASLETDAAGINVRRNGDTLYFDQRMYFLRARKTEE